MTHARLTLVIVVAALVILALNTLIVGVALQAINVDLGGLDDALGWRSAPSRLPSSCC